MDTEVEEMQFLGVGGIIKESVKLLYHHARLLLWFALILVLPLSFVLLGHSLVTNPLLDRIRSNEELFAAETREGDKLDALRTKRELYAEFGRLGLMILVYLLFLLALSLLSTAAIVYSVASIYLEKNVSVSKVLGVVPRVWRRLMVTFLWVFAIMTGYHVALVFGFAFVLLLFSAVPPLCLLLIIVLALGFLAIQVYLGLVWHLASVITVLEEQYGLAAIKKSLRLVKGKRVVGTVLILIYMILAGIISALFHAQVVYPAASSSPAWRFLAGSLLVALLTLLNLLGMLVQSLFYFSVKSYHHESIDRIILSDHLDAYLGEYVALKDPVQLEMLDQHTSSTAV